MNKEERRALERHAFAMRLGIHDPATCPACREDEEAPK